MDLVLNFSDEDFDEERKGEKKSRCKNINYKTRFETSKWFLSSDNENPKFRLNRLKYKGDYFYAQKDYHKAISEYACILEMMDKVASSVPLKREVFESLSRAYLKTGETKDALKYALLFHSTSNPVNSCNIFASFDLLSKVYLIMGDQTEIAQYCIIQMLIHRPHTPKAWDLLGDTYTDSLKATASWLRAIALYESVSKTVGSLVKEQYLLFVQDLNSKVQRKNLSKDIIVELSKRMTRDLLNESRGNEDSTFKDLGASARMKPIEEGYRPPTENKDFNMEWDLVVGFENKWFSS
nr:uncharacterized protein C8orf76 homolog [Lepeophtheirus salmonis]